jgi:hypothetical protein
MAFWGGAVEMLLQAYQLRAASRKSVNRISSFEQILMRITFSTLFLVITAARCMFRALIRAVPIATN